jgi:hypothetical protein
MSSRSYSQGGGGAAQQKQITQFLPRTILGFETPETEAFHEYLRNLAKKTDIYKNPFMFLSDEFGLSKQLITKIKKLFKITISQVTLNNYNDLKSRRLKTEITPPGFIYLGPLDEPGSPNVYTWFYQCGLGYAVLLKTPYKYDKFKFANLDKYEGMQIPSSVIKSVGSQRHDDKSISTNKTSSRMSTSSSGDVSHSRKQKSSSRQVKSNNF